MWSSTAAMRQDWIMQEQFLPSLFGEMAQKFSAVASTTRKIALQVQMDFRNCHLRNRRYSLRLRLHRMMVDRRRILQPHQHR